MASKRDATPGEWRVTGGPHRWIFRGCAICVSIIYLSAQLTSPLRCNENLSIRPVRRALFINFLICLPIYWWIYVAIYSPDYLFSYLQIMNLSIFTWSSICALVHSTCKSCNWFICRFLFKTFFKISFKTFFIWVIFILLIYARNTSCYQTQRSICEQYRLEIKHIAIMIRRFRNVAISKNHVESRAEKRRETTRATARRNSRHYQ